MAFEITRDHAYRRSHELRWRCPGCKEWGRINASDRDAALRIYGLAVNAGYKCTRGGVDG